MLKYSLRRLGYAIPLIFAVTVAAFLLIHLVPGDPGRIVLGPQASNSAVRAYDIKFGLNHSLMSQYIRFLRGVIHLQFGTSIVYGVSVGSLLIARIAPTGLLVLYGMIVSFAIGVPLGVLSAVKRNRWPDNVVRFIGMLTFVMPTFWLGLVLIIVFSLHWHIFPTSGYGQGIGGALLSLTLPAVSVAAFVSPVIMRSVRASMIETLSSDYVMAAHARGLSDRRVLVRHALRNSLVSTLTIVGVFTAGLFSMSVVIETVFGIQGIGQLLVTAVEDHDYPVVQAVTVLIGTVVILVNLCADLAYAFVDPRVRL